MLIVVGYLIITTLEEPPLEDRDLRCLRKIGADDPDFTGRECAPGPFTIRSGLTSLNREDGLQNISGEGNTPGCGRGLDLGQGFDSRQKSVQEADL